MGKRKILFWVLFIVSMIIGAIYMFILYSPDQTQPIDEYFDHNSEEASDCLSCHETEKPKRHFNGQCAYCHDDAAWNPSIFDHTFPMDHEDANGNCSLCHTDDDYQEYTCFSCHEHTPENIADKHAEEGIPDHTNCISCHTYEQESED